MKRQIIGMGRDQGITGFLPGLQRSVLRASSVAVTCGGISHVDLELGTREENPMNNLSAGRWFSTVLI